jgi:hypothetical protein
MRRLRLLFSIWLLTAFMTRGLSATNLATAWLNTMRGAGNGVTFTAPAALFAELHTGDPGAAGTTAVSSTTTRLAMGFGAPSGTGPVTMSLTTSPSWTSWAGTNGEVVTDVAVWSASTAGTFYTSVQLTASKTVNTGDTLTLSTFTFGLSPIAA